MPFPSISVFVSPTKSVRALFVGALTLAFLTQFASAQQTLGSINGTVTDASGAVVQGASVKAHAAATNLEVTAQSKSDGSFSITDLPIGTFEVTFAKEGFQTAAYPQISAEDFVESIPFTETRFYVMVVLANRDQYRRLYGLDKPSTVVPLAQGPRP